MARARLNMQGVRCMTHARLNMQGAHLKMQGTSLKKQDAWLIMQDAWLIVQDAWLNMQGAWLNMQDAWRERQGARLRIQWALQKCKVHVKRASSTLFLKNACLKARSKTYRQGKQGTCPKNIKCLSQSARGMSQSSGLVHKSKLHVSEVDGRSQKQGACLIWHSECRKVHGQE